MEALTALPNPCQYLTIIKQSDYKLEIGKYWKVLAYPFRDMKNC